MWRSRINSEEKSQEGKRMKIESGGNNFWCVSNWPLVDPGVSHTIDLKREKK